MTQDLAVAEIESDFDPLQVALPGDCDSGQRIIQAVEVPVYRSCLKAMRLQERRAEWSAVGLERIPVFGNHYLRTRFFWNLRARMLPVIRQMDRHCRDGSGAAACRVVLQKIRVLSKILVATELPGACGRADWPLEARLNQGRSVRRDYLAARGPAVRRGPKNCGNQARNPVAASVAEAYCVSEVRCSGAWTVPRGHSVPRTHRLALQTSAEVSAGIRPAL